MCVVLCDLILIGKFRLSKGVSLTFTQFKLCSFCCFYVKFCLFPFCLTMGYIRHNKVMVKRKLDFRKSIEMLYLGGF